MRREEAGNRESEVFERNDASRPVSPSRHRSMPAVKKKEEKKRRCASLTKLASARSATAWMLLISSTPLLWIRVLSRYILAFALTYNGAPLFLLGIVDMHFGKPTRTHGKLVVSLSNCTRKLILRSSFNYRSNRLPHRGRSNC